MDTENDSPKLMIHFVYYTRIWREEEERKEEDLSRKRRI